MSACKLMHVVVCLQANASEMLSQVQVLPGTWPETLNYAQNDIMLILQYIVQGITTMLVIPRRGSCMPWGTIGNT